MAQLATVNQKSRQVWRGSAGDYQADEHAGVEQLRWRLSGRRTGRWHAVQLAYIKQMSRQVSSSSTGEYQAEEQAGVARFSWRISSR